MPPSTGADNAPDNAPDNGTENGAAKRGQRDRSSHLACPFCTSYDVNRLYIASINVDSCECCSCGARWDEDCGSGKYRGRSDRSSVLFPRGS